MLPDMEKYIRQLNIFDLNEARKKEVVHELWAMMFLAIDAVFAEHSKED